MDVHESGKTYDHSNYFTGHQLEGTVGRDGGCKQLEHMKVREKARQLRKKIFGSIKIENLLEH
jgi:hypothetical protein